MTYTIVRDGFFFRVVASNGWRSTALTSMSAAALVKRRLEARKSIAIGNFTITH